MTILWSTQYKSFKSYKHNSSIRRTNEKLYSDHNPIEAKTLKEKINLLNTVDQYLRSKSNLVKQVTASISTEKKKYRDYKNWWHDAF